MIYVERFGLKEDETAIFDKVLIIGGENGVKIGRPLIEGATVEGIVVTRMKNLRRPYEKQ